MKLGKQPPPAQKKLASAGIQPELGNTKNNPRE